MSGPVPQIRPSNLHKFYSVPVIVPAVPADDFRNCVPSDHSTAIAAPISDSETCRSNDYVTKTTRPMPDSGVRTFGRWISQHDWDTVKLATDPSSKCTFCELY